MVRAEAGGRGVRLWAVKGDTSGPTMIYPRNGGKTNLQFINKPDEAINKMFK